MRGENEVSTRILSTRKQAKLDTQRYTISQADTLQTEEKPL